MLIDEKKDSIDSVWQIGIKSFNVRMSVFVMSV